jgi:hypothetical protein
MGECEIHGGIEIFIRLCFNDESNDDNYIRWFSGFMERQIVVSYLFDAIRKSNYKLLNEKDAGNPASCSSESAHFIKIKNCKENGRLAKVKRGCSSLKVPIDRVKGNLLKLNKEFTFFFIS